MCVACNTIKHTIRLKLSSLQFCSVLSLRTVCAAVGCVRAVTAASSCDDEGHALPPQQQQPPPPLLLLLLLLHRIIATTISSSSPSSSSSPLAQSRSLLLHQKSPNAPDPPLPAVSCRNWTRCFFSAILWPFPITRSCITITIITNPT